MSGRIGEQDRDCFARLVEVLLPEGSGMPAGASVDVAGTGLDQVLDLRPDLTPDLLAALRGIRGLAPEEAVVRLQGEGGDSWRAVRVAAFGAYYNSPALRERLGYAGQTARAIEHDPVSEQGMRDLLAPVLARPPMWRSAPR